MVDFNIKKIEDFLMSAPRYRFVVITKGFDQSDFQVLDVGHELACCIKNDVSEKKNLPIIASEKLLKLFDDNITEHPKFRNYICLDNIGILFEPALGLNPTLILQQLSKKALLILLWKGAVDKNKLFFLNKGSEHVINLTEINHIIL